MDRSEVETTVREWLDPASVNPTTGLPTDAKVSVAAHHVTTIGQLVPGQSRPESGMELWSVTATLYFQDGSSTWEQEGDLGLEICQVLTRLEDSLEADHSLGRPALRVEFRGTDADRPHERPSSPPGYPWAVDAYLSVHALDV